MERTKKVDQAKNASKTEQNAAKEPEKMGQPQEAALEPETTSEKTSREDAAKIAASVVDVKLEMDENGEIVVTGQEPDVLARLPDPCVYCGPSVKGVARQYTTYQGGIPDTLRAFIGEHPEALGLMVSTGGFQTMRRKLEKPGTPEAELYKAVKESLKE